MFSHTDEKKTKARKKKIKAAFPTFFNPQGKHKLKKTRKLDGGLTNQTLLVRTSSNKYVARIPGAGTDQLINRAEESYNTKLAYDAGITPEVVYDKPDGRKITRFLRHPNAMTKEMLEDPTNISIAMLVLRKLHDIATPFANTISIFDRNRDVIKILAENGKSLEKRYLDLLNQIDEIEDVFKTFKIKKVPCHNDTTPGNFVFSDDKGIQMIDFEYSGNNDPLWDLACLAMEAAFTDKQCQTMLESYFGTELDEDITRRFYLYHPVVEFWTILWTQWRMSNVSDKDYVSELTLMEQTRYVHCVNLLASERIKDFIEQDQGNKLSYCCHM